MSYLFILKIKHEEERKDLIVDLMKPGMNTLYGKSFKKDIDEE